jgi:hypothetical protein
MHKKHFPTQSDESNIYEECCTDIHVIFCSTDDLSPFLNARYYTLAKRQGTGSTVLERIFDDIFYL